MLPCGTPFDPPFLSFLPLLVHALVLLLLVIVKKQRYAKLYVLTLFVPRADQISLRVNTYSCQGRSDRPEVCPVI